MVTRDQQANDIPSWEDLEEPQSVSAALEANGWQLGKASPDTYRLGPNRRAQLTLLVHGAQVARYQLSGAALESPRAGTVLTQNSSLHLPAKFVSWAKRQVKCVVDVPVDAILQADSIPNHSTLHSSEFAAWARGLTAALHVSCNGAPINQQGPIQHAPLEEVAGWLGQLGWATSVEDRTLEVHLQLPNLYRQLQIAPGQSGYHVYATLMTLDDLSGPSARSVRELALEANRRLPLVRFSEDVMADPPRLVAEVMINEAAVTTTSRELLALRDPELAQIFLAEHQSAQLRKE